MTAYSSIYIYLYTSPVRLGHFGIHVDVILSKLSGLACSRLQDSTELIEQLTLLTCGSGVYDS